MRGGDLILMFFVYLSGLLITVCVVEAFTIYYSSPPAVPDRGYYAPSPLPNRY